MKASDYFAKVLSNYTNIAFTGQGGSVVHILDSIKKQKKIKIIPSQNEQGASLAADAFSRKDKKKIGLVIATSGPGIINCIQGIACSYYDSIPSLYISGAPVTAAIKKNLKLRQLGFQEMDVMNIVKSFTKYSVRITDPNNIKYEIEKCINISNHGRRGPCLIDLPDDIQRKEIDPKNQKNFFFKKPSINKINNKRLQKVSNLIDRSKKPLIIIGNGINNIENKVSLNKFISKTNFPYAPTWGAIDHFNSSDNKNVGSFGVYATRYGNYAVQNSDLLIILGSRMNGTLIGGNPKLFSKNSVKIQVDIDKAELVGENRLKVNYKFNNELSYFLKKLNSKIKKQKPRKDWLEQIKNWKSNNKVVTKKFSNQKNYVNPYVFFEKLSEVINTNDILIPDASANLVWAYQAFKFKKNQKVFTSLNHSPMGYSVAAAIGASLANPRSKIIATIGDGSMQMNIQEIQNIKYFNLPIKIFILNTYGYGMVKQTIDTWLKGNYVGCDLKSNLSLPNYQKVFRSYKIKSIIINNNDNLKKHILKVMNYDGPIMCELKIDPNQRIEPKVKFGSSLDKMLP